MCYFLHGLCLCVISAFAPDACGSRYVVTYSHQRVRNNPRSCHWIRSFWNCLRSILQHSLYITSRSHDDDVFSFIRWLSRSFPVYCRHFNICTQMWPYCCLIITIIMKKLDCSSPTSLQLNCCNSKILIISHNGDFLFSNLSKISDFWNTEITDACTWTIEKSPICA